MLDLGNAGSTPLREILESLETEVAEPVELTDRAAFRAACDAADALVACAPAPATLVEIEALLAGSGAPLMVQLALKLARSKSAVLGLESPAFLSVVFAVYKEHQRVLSSDLHPHGEDFLRAKVRQLEWLAEGSTQLGWKLIVVDDGCPERSGEIIESIVADSGLQGSVDVLYLERAIRERIEVTRPLISADESRKGGAVQYGMWHAAREDHPGHVIVFTDADLSTHLGQTGLLLEAVRAGKLAAIGSRREPTSVVVKSAGRNDRGKLFIYLWKRMLTPLNYITDTQCGFKAFDARIVPGLVTDTIEKQFAFDIELMLRSELEQRGSIAKVPIAWIDSEDLSTTTDLQPYLPMLKQVAAMYRRYLPETASADAFAELVESLDETQWQRLLSDIPSAITRRNPADFDRFADVSAEDLRQRAAPH